MRGLTSATFAIVKVSVRPRVSTRRIFPWSYSPLFYTFSLVRRAQKDDHRTHATHRLPPRLPRHRQPAICPSESERPGPLRARTACARNVAHVAVAPAHTATCHDTAVIQRAGAHNVSSRFMGSARCHRARSRCISRAMGNDTARGACALVYDPLFC